MFVVCEKSMEKTSTYQYRGPNIRSNVLQELGGCKWVTRATLACFLTTFVTIFGEIFLEKIFKKIFLILKKNHTILL
jgi:hypothetical protein